MLTPVTVEFRHSSPWVYERVTAFASTASEVMRKTVRDYMRRLGWTETDPWLFVPSLGWLEKRIDEEADSRVLDELREVYEHTGVAAGPPARETFYLWSSG